MHRRDDEQRGTPTRAASTINGACGDQAGNEYMRRSRCATTRPRRASPTDDVQVGNGDATPSWKQLLDTAKVEVVRTPGRGKPGPTAVYSGDGTRFRDAGLKTGVAFRYTLDEPRPGRQQRDDDVKAQLRQLYAPAPGAKIAAGGALRWVTAKGAAYDA